ncbi:transposase domain-containing protein [Paenibacillus sepulcri]
MKTAKENGLHPFRYLKYLFGQFPRASGFPGSERTGTLYALLLNFL